MRRWHRSEPDVSGDASFVYLVSCGFFVATLRRDETPESAPKPACHVSLAGEAATFVCPFVLGLHLSQGLHTAQSTKHHQKTHRKPRSLKSLLLPGLGHAGLERLRPVRFAQPAGWSGQQ